MVGCQKLWPWRSESGARRMHQLIVSCISICTVLCEFAQHLRPRSASAAYSSLMLLGAFTPSCEASVRRHRVQAILPEKKDGIEAGYPGVHFLRLKLIST